MPPDQSRTAWPWATLTLCLLTFIVTLYVSWQQGSVFSGPDSIRDLERWGGVTPEQIRSLEVWRLATAQFLHLKPPHMLYNVISLFFAGLLIERRLGASAILVLWFAGGGLATLFSTLFVPAPYNVGTGASQAVCAFAGGLAILFIRKKLPPRPFALVAALIIAPVFAIDFIFAGYPKPGHLAGLVLGATLTLFLDRHLIVRAKDQ